MKIPALIVIVRVARQPNGRASRSDQVGACGRVLLRGRIVPGTHIVDCTLSGGADALPLHDGRYMV